jgi:predicted RNA-binding Zn-ribbon protein involved in translation (DUF1610 family)
MKVEYVYDEKRSINMRIMESERDKTCDDCGDEMKLVIVKKATFKTRKIAHYECKCGFKRSYEPMAERERRMNQEFDDLNVEEGIV